MVMEKHAACNVTIHCQWDVDSIIFRVNILAVHRNKCTEKWFEAGSRGDLETMMEDLHCPHVFLTFSAANI